MTPGPWDDLPALRDPRSPPPCDASTERLRPEPSADPAGPDAPTRESVAGPPTDDPALPTLPFGHTLPTPAEGAGLSLRAGAELAPGLVVEGPLPRTDFGRQWYRARHAQHGPCDVQLLTAEAAEAIGAKALLEARLATLVEGPLLVPVVDLGAEPRPWIATASPQAPTLRSVWSRRATPPQELLEIACDVAAGLQRAAAHRLLHGDLAPEAIFVHSAAEPGRPRAQVGGFARVGDVVPLGPKVAYIGAPLQGPAHYTAPERFETGARCIAGDVYSLGAILFEGLSGAPPFPGDDPQAVRSACLQDPLPEVSLSDPLAQRLLAVATRCLARQRGERYPSLDALVAALDAARAPPPLAWPKRGAALGLVLLSATALAAWIWTRLAG